MGAHNVWHNAFFTALSNCGNVRQACKDANVDPKTVYKKRKREPEFAEEWDDALNVAADVLEKEAWRRAHEGIEEPVYHKGAVCGHVRKYSDVLLIFLLKGMRPEKYRERVFVSPAEMDKLIEQQLKMLKGEGEEAEADQTSNALS